LAVPVLLGLFDMPPEELPELPPEVPLELLPLLPLLDPVEPEPVLLLELGELLPPAALPCDALYSSRLSFPSWSLSSCSNDLLPELDEELPPEAALLLADEPVEPDEPDEDEPEAPEDDGLLLLLCDMDGDFVVLLDCFDVSLA
jgi:hypothetical protein